jgi:hypothetical protein
MRLIRFQTFFKTQAIAVRFALFLHRTYGWERKFQAKNQCYPAFSLYEEKILEWGLQVDRDCCLITFMDIKHKSLTRMFASSHEPKVNIITITPEMASALLELNTLNRPLSRGRVRMYADQMKRGQWKVNGESIKTSCNPLTGDVRLLDGQHRLVACVESGVSFETLAVSDLDESVFSVIDRGKARGNHDVLAIAGIKNGSHIAPAVKYFICLEAGLNPRNKDAIMLISAEDVLDYVRLHSDHVEWAYQHGRRIDSAIGGIRTAWIIFAGIIAMERGETDSVDAFLQPMVSGENLVNGDPRLALRNWVIRNGNTRSGAVTIENVATYIRAYNQWVAGESLKVVRPWTSTSDWPKINTTDYGPTF